MDLEKELARVSLDLLAKLDVWAVHGKHLNVTLR